MQPWPTSSIIGAAGYTGQETLDRVLAHPELELYAVGSDSLAGRDASALDPRLNRNGGDACPASSSRTPRRLPARRTSRSSASPTRTAAALVPPSRGVIVDLSGAHRLAEPALYERVVRVRPPTT